jgi:hypothetical protein
MHLRGTLHAGMVIITVSLILGFIASVRAATPVSVPSPQVMPNGAVLRPTTRVYEPFSLNFTKIEFEYMERMKHLTGSGETDPTVVSPAASVSAGTLNYLRPGELPTFTNYIARLELARTAPGSDLYAVTIPQFDIFGGVLDAHLLVRESPTLVSGGFATLSADSSGLGYLLALEFSVHFEWSEDGGQTWNPTIGEQGFLLTGVPEPAAVALLIPAALLLRRRRG